MSLNDTLRDAAYIAIGMGVIGVQRAQVRREEIRKQLDSQRAILEARGAEALKVVEGVVRSATGGRTPS